MSGCIRTHIFVFLYLVSLIGCGYAQLDGTWVGTGVLAGVTSPAMVKINGNKFDLFAATNPIFSGFISVSGTNVNISVVKITTVIRQGSIVQNGNLMTLTLNKSGNFTFPGICPTCTTFSLQRQTLTLNSTFFGSWVGTVSNSQALQSMVVTSDKLSFPSNDVSVGIDASGKLFLGFVTFGKRFGTVSTAKIDVDKTFGNQMTLVVSGPNLDDVTCSTLPCDIYTLNRQDPTFDASVEGIWVGPDQTGTPFILKLDNVLNDTGVVAFQLQLGDSGIASTESGFSNVSNALNLVYSTSAVVLNSFNQIQHGTYSLLGLDSLQLVMNNPGNSSTVPIIPFSTDLADAFATQIEPVCPSCSLFKFLRFETTLDPLLASNWFGFSNTQNVRVPAAAVMRDQQFFLNGLYNVIYTRAAESIVALLDTNGDVRLGRYQRRGGCLNMLFAPPGVSDIPVSVSTPFEQCPTCVRYDFVCEQCVCDELQSGAPDSQQLPMFLLLLLLSFFLLL